MAARRKKRTGWVRHPTDSVRDAVKAVRKAVALRVRAEAEMAGGLVDLRERYGFSLGFIYQISALCRSGTKELIDAVQSGKITVYLGYKLCRLPPEEQRAELRKPA